jgi:hypothetical protein
MSEKEFGILIESIGFRYNGFYYDYDYKEFRINLYLYVDHYDFFNGFEWIKHIPYTDLRPELLKLIRSIKLKQLLR